MLPVMWVKLCNALRVAGRYPVTTGIVAVAVCLHIAVLVTGQINPQNALEAPRSWGAVTQLVVVGEKELFGPLELWDGQWWRVPISGFHHGGLLHLALNCLAIAFMGRLLEPRMRRGTYFAFFLCATGVSVLPEFLMEHYAIGLSGGAYAMFGVLWVLRRSDVQVADSFHEGMVRWGLIWLVACVVLTALDILRIANMAHFFGLAYGWFAGQVLFGSRSSRPLFRVGFCASHLLLFPAFYLVVHPFWIGRYHWYLGLHEQDLVKKLEQVQAASEYDSGLSGPWRIQAVLFVERGDVNLAWKTVLRGLNYNRSDEKSIKLARSIWRKLPTIGQRKQALQTLKEIFQDEEPGWRERLGLVPVDANDPFLQVAGNEDRENSAGPHVENGDSHPPNLTPGFNGIEEYPIRDLTAPPVDPDDPASAAEGVET